MTLFGGHQGSGGRRVRFRLTGTGVLTAMALAGCSSGSSSGASSGAPAPGSSGPSPTVASAAATPNNEQQKPAAQVVQDVRSAIVAAPTVTMHEVLNGGGVVSDVSYQYSAQSAEVVSHIVLSASSAANPMDSDLILIGPQIYFKGNAGYLKSVAAVALGVGKNASNLVPDTWYGPRPSTPAGQPVMYRAYLSTLLTESMLAQVLTGPSRATTYQGQPVVEYAAQAGVTADVAATGPPRLLHIGVQTNGSEAFDLSYGPINIAAPPNPTPLPGS